MARIRTIKPTLYGDEKIIALPEKARFVAVGMISYADDRGRGQLLIPALRGFIYPSGDVAEREVSRRVDAILEVGFARAYESGLLRYFWLPNFWRHQVINRPTESLLPAHPDDPYADLKVVEALRRFREDSLSDHGGLTPSRVGARSISISPSSPDVPNSNDNGDQKPGRKPSASVDQDQLPDDLAEHLQATVREVHPRLVSVYQQRGGDLPTLRGVGLAVAAFPDRNHAGVCEDLEHWALTGKGRNQSVVDWSRTYRTFLRRAVPGSAPRSSAVTRISEAQARNLRRLDSMRRLAGGAA